jgi:hypothetical protein
METGVWIFVLGMAGGFVNAIIPSKLGDEIALKELRMPHVYRTTEEDQNGKKRELTLIDLGWIGNVIVGGAAAFVLWTMQITNTASPQVYGIALLAGLGGARVLNDLFEKQALIASRDKATIQLAAEITAKQKKDNSEK